MNTRLFRLLALSLALLGGACVAQAQDLGAVRARMEQRLSQIDTLKSQGAIGENNQGFLEVRAASGDASTVVSSENSDRSAVYAALAQKTGASADAVGKARARQIAANSAPGVWVQRESGEWYKK